MGLDQWLRAEEGVKHTSEKIKEDLLEALFGTIDTILMRNTAFGYGFGARVCMKFLERLFTRDSLQLNRFYEPPKTYFQQLFQRLFGTQKTGWVEETKDNGNQYIVTITQEGINKLAEENKTIDQRQWVARANTSKVAEAQAYRLAARHLYGKGITTDWVDAIKYNRDIKVFSIPVQRKMILNAREIDNDIISVKIINTYTSVTSFVFQIIGKNKGR